MIRLILYIILGDGMYSIEQFQRLNKPESMVLTQHSRKRFAERGISIDDIGYVFRTGEIIA